MKYPLSLAALSLSLILTGCGGGSGSDDPQPQPQNKPPVAKITLDQTHIDVAQTIVISAQQSSDPEQDNLTFAWQVTDPQGNAVTLDNPSGQTLSFTPMHPGTYNISLKVTDSKGNAHQTQVTLQAGELTPAMLNISADNVAVVAQSTALYAAFSQFDDIGVEQPTFSWQILDKPAASQVQLGNQQGIRTRFIPDSAGQYVLELTATTSKRTLTAQHAIWADNPDSAKPVAEIHADFVQTWPNKGIRLTAYGKEGNGVLWSVSQAPAGSEVELSTPTSLESNFFADLPGQYEIALLLNNGTQQNTITTTLEVLEDQQNRKPVASINNVVNMFEPYRPGTGITLHGEGKDRDNDSLSYQWHLLQKPDASQAALTNAKTKTALINFDAEGDYLVSLTVSDGQLTSAPVFFTMPVQANHAPLASIQGQSRINLGQPLTLDASGSFDSESDTLSYQWSVKKAPQDATPSLTDASKVKSQFSTQTPGEYLIELLVNDGHQDSYHAMHWVKVEEGHAPQARIDVENGKLMTLGNSITLDASGSQDQDNDPLTYQWRLNSGPSEQTSQFGDMRSARLNFTPEKVGHYDLQVTVSDGVNQDIEAVRIEVVDSQNVYHFSGKALDYLGNPIYPLTVIGGRKGYQARANEQGQFDLVVVKSEQESWPLKLTFSQWFGGNTINYMDLEEPQSNNQELGEIKLARPQTLTLTAEFCEGFKLAGSAIYIKQDGAQPQELEFNFYGALTLTRTNPTVTRKLPAPARFMLYHRDAITLELADGSNQFDFPLQEDGQAMTKVVKICHN
ncbi:PKD domain-containing protein [Bowmanella denitrificans]|uniref:PKD domain-containing protein n=1 Tax=Bowmanella denitrificans TaxID=366582 RepID=UPI000C9AC8B5|nr:PKD domain-containing protein [Bowmanella denitrificans]